jgi:hypothetical protein
MIFDCISKKFFDLKGQKSGNGTYVVYVLFLDHDKNEWTPFVS